MRADSLASDIRAGNRRALAKGISLVENKPGAGAALLKALRPPRRAFILGVTGPPGTGKSTLVGRLIAHYREVNLKVGVLAIDPSSPVTGGALLGDRIRMKAHYGDKGVFIRSMASRGWTGGLSKAASEALQLMDSAGFDVIILETVGTGQADVEVVGVAHAVLVVVMPGLGDDVQASKAGLMEVGDVYVVNKSDLEGADAAVVSLLSMLRDSKGRSSPVVKTSALKDEGIERLAEVTESFRSKLDGEASGLKLRSIRGMVVETAKGEVMEKFERFSAAKADDLARLVLEGRLTVNEAAARLVKTRLG